LCVSINKQLTSFKNCFDITAHFCQEKKFSYFKYVRGQHNTVVGGMLPVSFTLSGPGSSHGLTLPKMLKLFFFFFFFKVVTEEAPRICSQSIPLLRTANTSNTE
jgi:hypothetical protein